MNHHQQKPPLSWGLISIFIIVSTVLFILGILFLNSQKKHILNDKENELAAVVNLKVGQISQWRHEKIGDANLIHDNLSLSGQIYDFLNGSDIAIQRKELLKWMNSIINNYDYLSANLIDTRGKVRLSVPEEDSIIGPMLRPLIPLALDNQKIILTDLHRVTVKNYIHIDLLIPMVRYENKDSSTIGMIILRINPEKILYPLVQTWPTLSKTSETLILEQDGDSIVYLNNLKHLPNSALSLRKSVYDEKLIGAKAVLGFAGITEGVDYRNVEVIAAVKKIPDSPWYMVSKIDREEIDSSFSEQLLLARLMIIFFVSAFGAVIGWMIWNQRVRYYREKYEAELDRLAVIKHFDYILKYANDIILLIDNDLNIIEANDRAIEVYKYTRNELIGMKLIQLRLPDLAQQMDDQIKILNETSYSRFETIHVCKDGTTFPVEISARLVEIEGIKYYQSIGRNITERKFAEDTLKESEEKFRKIFEESPISILMADNNFQIIRINPSFCKLLGYDESEIMKLTFRDFTHPDHIRNDEMALYELTEGKIPIYRTEKRYFRKDRSVIWGSTTVSLIRDSNDQVQYFLAMVEDITLRKESEFQIEESNSLLRTTLESTADGILVVDLTGKIVQFNRKFTEMWKIPETIINSRDDEKVISFVRDQLKEPDSFVSNVRHLYENPNSVSFDLLEFSDGRVFERYSQPQKISNEIIGRVWSFRDISQHKFAESQLISAKEKAEESDRLKTAFLHNISHEIRTPMNAIVGFTALLDDPDLQPVTRKQYIDIIYQSSDQLLSIITDIVDISNIETGQIKVTLNQVNINYTIRNLFEQYSLRAAQQGLSIHYKLTLNDDEALIETDGIKLIHILSNLLNNSLKFTKEGKIEFGYTLKDGFIEFIVSDTGIGISEDKQDKIFERFYQAENSISRRYGGTGLGLSICRAYAELLGGSINVESELGKGSIFYLILPFKSSVKNINVNKIEHKRTEEFFSGKTILIAEDDDINFLVVKKSLEPYNFNIVRAIDGKEAVEICRSNNEINLVLLDLKMPVMDGLKAMNMIKQFRPHLPFIALTAYAFESDKKYAIESGCSDYITKPFSNKDLMEILRKHLWQEIL
jgi:PAS domain S-box-containing protein